MTTYRVLESDDWGMVWVRPPVKERQGDPEQFIHHRAGNPQHTTDAAVVFRQMQAADVGRGYSTVGYDILVHENTDTDTVTIGVARGQWMSAATADRNEQGEAICAIGYFEPGHKLSARPSAGMLEGLARACVLSIHRGWNSADALLLGHRQNPAHLGATACPGDYLMAEMPTIRARVAELLRPTPPTPEPLPPEDDMKPFLWRDSRYQNVFLVEAANAITVDETTRDRALAEGIRMYVGTHDQLLQSCRTKAGLAWSDLEPV